MLQSYTFHVFVLLYQFSQQLHASVIICNPCLANVNVFNLVVLFKRFDYLRHCSSSKVRVVVYLKLLKHAKVFHRRYQRGDCVSVDVYTTDGQLLDPACSVLPQNFEEVSQRLA